MSIKKGEADGRFFANLSIQVAAMSVALFVLVKEIAPKCGKTMLKMIGWIRKDLFGVYLTHLFWLEIVGINNFAFRHYCSEIITMPLIAIVVFILSLLTTKLIRLIPFLRKVVE